MTRDSGSSGLTGGEGAGSWPSGNRPEDKGTGKERIDDSDTESRSGIGQGNENINKTKKAADENRLLFACT